MRLRLLKRASCVVLLPLLICCSTKEKNESAGFETDPALAQSVEDGKLVYEKNCRTCHLSNGQGAPPMNPPLTKTSFVTGEAVVLIKVVLDGMSNLPVDGERYRNVMPPFNYLTDQEIADVANYVRHAFGNGGEIVTATEVTAARGSLNSKL